MVNITLEEIIRRRISYWQNDEFYNLTDDERAGYLRGLSEMLEDMRLEEEVFLEKYLNILRSLSGYFDSQEELAAVERPTAQMIEELSGYNNAVVHILTLLDERFFYDLSDK